MRRLRAVAFPLALLGASALARAEPALADSVTAMREQTLQLPHEPRRLRSVEPEYPPAAVSSEEEGDVSFECTVDADGRVVGLRPQESHDLFTPAAAAAIRQWRYEPTRDPRPRSFPVSIRFRLPQKAIHHLPVGAVLERLRSPDRRASHEAFRELVGRGASILPALIDELRTGDTERRCATLHFLGALGSAARAAAPLLLDLFHEVVAANGSPLHCHAIGDTLARIDRATFEAALRDAVREANAAACRLLLAAASFRRNVPRPVFDALELEGCRDAASQALMDLADTAALTRILRAANNASPVARARAMQTVARLLRNMSPDERQAHAAEVVPALVAALSDPDANVRRAAAGALSVVTRERGADVTAAVPALAAAVGDADEGVRRSAVNALAASGPKARAAGPALLKALASMTESHRNTEGGLYRDLRWAIAATGAGRSDAQLEAEDEMRAVAVAHVLEEERRSGAERKFTLSVLGGPASAVLLRELARRGLAPITAAGDGVLHMALGAVEWIAGDLAVVQIGVGREDFRTYVVALQEGAWAVVGSGPRLVS